MLAIQGYFDGASIQPLEKITAKPNQRVIITIMDYVVPSLSTKKHGGSKAGVWGCNIGLIISIVGLPFGPQGIIGVIFWPFVGALVGELLGGKKSREALRAAWGAFVGFLCGTGLKLAYALVCAFFVVKDLIS